MLSDSDTDLDWKYIGATDPYFGVLTHSRFRRENITPDAREAFFESGRQDVEFIASHLANVDAIKSALDFGCSVGRLSIALAARFCTVVGIDVSASMLTEATRNAKDFDIMNARFTSDFPDEKSDLVVSYIVFQHIAPHQGLGLLRKLLDRAEIGGQAAIQITFYHAVTKKKNWLRLNVKSKIKAVFKKLGYKRKMEVRILMHDYDATDVLRIFFDVGFRSLSLIKTDHGGCIGAWIFGRRV